jgi:hypothetical protein
MPGENATGVPRGPAGTIPLEHADAKFTGERTGDRAGWSVTGVGDVNGDGVDDVAVAAPRSDRPGQNAGTVYLFYGPVNPADLDTADADATFLGEAAGDHAGFAVAPAGDLDGDGNDDVLIGAPFSDVGGTSSGAVYVVTGGDLSGTQSLSGATGRLVGVDSGDRVGWSVDSVNATGGNGIVIGAPTADGAADASGLVYVVEGSRALSTTNVTDANLTLVGQESGERAGTAVAGVGDVDDDGSPDLLVGAPGTSQAENSTGTAYLLANVTDRSGTIALSNATAEFEGTDGGDQAGFAVAGGDVNGDGVDDLVVGAPTASVGDADDGAVYIVHGNASLQGTVALADADVVLGGEGPNDRAGWSVAVPGDVNADGAADVLVGAPYNDSSHANAGAGYLLYGTRLGQTQSLESAPAKFVGEGEGDLAGLSVAGAGDVDGDGSSDLLVGAPFNDSHRNAGAAYLVYGRTAPTPTPTETPTEQEGTPTATPSPTPTPTPEPIDVTVEFGCEVVTVTAEEYTRVALQFVEGGTQVFTSVYSGTNTFTGTGDDEGKVIRKVEVFSGPDTFRAVQSDAEGCDPAVGTPTPSSTPTPSPTPTSSPTPTPSPSPTPTATPTPSPTATPTQSPTPTPTPTSTPSLEPPLSGEPPAISWTSAVGGSDTEEALAVVRTGDGGYVLAGGQEDGATTAWAKKLTERGTVEWTLTPAAIGGPARESRFTAAAPTPDGGTLLVGWMEREDRNRTGWVVKVAADGDVAWNRTYNGTPPGDYEFDAVEAVPGDGYLLAGVAGADDQRDTGQGWAVRIGPDGDQRWARQYAAGSDGGGPGFDAFESVAAGPDGGFVLAGLSSPGETGLDSDAWAVQIGEDGDVVWDRTYGGPGNDTFASVIPAQDGSFLFAGEATVGGWVVGTGDSGMQQWERRFDGGSLEGGAAVPGGGVFAGQLDGAGWAVSVTAGGAVRWGAAYEDAVALSGATGTGAGNGVVLAGAFAGPPGDGWAVQVGPPMLSDTATPTDTVTPTSTEMPTPTVTPTDTPNATETPTESPNSTGSPPGTETETDTGTGTDTETDAGTPTSSLVGGPADGLVLAMLALGGIVALRRAPRS